jgi:hypothetical protein
VQSRGKKISPDRNWLNHRDQPQYWALLRETARAWLSLLRLRDGQGVCTSQEHLARRAVYSRLTTALPQLPIEWMGSESRYNRSRWRLDTVVSGLPMHCEHPWSKKITRKLIETLYTNSRAEDEELVDSISLILDARQDTVLLPSANLSSVGVLSEKNHDGLHSRYTPVLAQHKLIDRMTGAPLTAEELDQIDEQVEYKLQEAFHSCAPGWLKSTLVEHPTVIDSFLRLPE